MRWEWVHEVKLQIARMSSISSTSSGTGRNLLLWYDEFSSSGSSTRATRDIISIHINPEFEVDNNLRPGLTNKLTPRAAPNKTVKMTNTVCGKLSTVAI